MLIYTVSALVRVGMDYCGSGLVRYVFEMVDFRECGDGNCGALKGRESRKFTSMYRLEGSLFYGLLSLLHDKLWSLTYK